MQMELKPNAVSDLLAREKKRISKTNQEREAIVDCLIACAPQDLRFFLQQRRAGVKEITEKGQSSTYLFLGDFPFRKSGLLSIKEAREILESLREAWKNAISIDIVERGEKEKYFELIFGAK